MNILPIVLALILVISVMTVERLEKFKNQVVVQKAYQIFLETTEGEEFNRREELLFLKSRTTHRQLSFRYILDKELRDKDANVAKQYRQIAIDLIKILYQNARFYKTLEAKHSDFVDDLITEIEKAADEAPDGTIKRIDDMSKLKLSDPDLQDAFYHMLKGTLTRDQWNALQDDVALGNQIISPRRAEKLYISLLTYVHFQKTRPQIQLAPSELLLAIFESPQVVEEILIKRQELSRNKMSQSEADFQSEFNPKRKPGLDDQILDFKISQTDKSKYD